MILPEALECADSRSRCTDYRDATLDQCVIGMGNNHARQLDIGCRINALERIVRKVELKGRAIVNTNGCIGEFDCIIRNCEVNARADN